MQPDRKKELFERAKTIVVSALERPAAERDAFLDRACARDAAVRAEVDSLLAHAVSAPDLLATSGAAAAMSRTFLRSLDHAAATALPDAIGPYRVIGLVGEGGMGTVYVAEQMDPLPRRVAIKVIRSGLDTERIVQRFDAERRALARMGHRSIARVFDAGTTEDRRPYFVMELVEGLPVTAFCDAHRLPVRARLELFLSICAGVHHAHQRGIIHRDLKPSNILVRELDGVPEPKVIDFGILKAVEPDGQATLTLDGAVIGTPEYMSPEQAGVVDAETDTRTDVYSLGALLYELLTGRWPHEFRTHTPAEVHRVLTGNGVARPSTAIGGAEASADARGCSLDQLRRQLRGDLDSIVLRALAMMPDDRYASVERLADDVRRRLDGLPVLAREATWSYRAARFVARHRVEVAGGAVIVALLVAFSGTTWRQSRRLADERDRAFAAERLARTEAATAQRTADFLTELFSVSRPGESRGNTVTAREILDRGAERIRKDLADEPAVQAALMSTMGDVYRRLGLYDPAKTLLEASVDTSRRVLGDRDPQVAASLHNLARVLRDRDELARAEVLQREAVAIRRSLTDRPPGDLADSLSVLAGIVERRGKTDEAEQLYVEAIRRFESAYGPDDWRIATSVNNLASLYHDRAAYARAEPMYRRALALERAHYGDEHPEVAITMNNLASLLEETGRAAEAEPLYVESLRIRRAVYGEVHPAVATALNNLAGVRLDADPAGAVKLYREAVAIHLARQGKDHPLTLATRANLGRALHRSGQLDEAERVYAAVLADARRRWPKGHTTVSTILLRQGQLFADRGRWDRAEKSLREALAMRRSLLAADHPGVAEAEGALGDFLMKRGRLDEAEPLLVSSHATLLKRFGEAHPRTREASKRLQALRAARQAVKPAS